MKNAWNRDVINGDAHSRAEFFSYGLTTIGIGIIGDKGLSRAGQLGNAAKLSNIGKIGNVANKIPPPIPINKGLTPAFATGTVNTIPYNVMDDLYNRIHQASKEVFGDSRGGKVPVDVDVIGKGTGKGYTGGRTQAELDALSYDSAKKAVTKGSKKEAVIGLELEQRGEFGKLERSLDPKAEFIDTTTGKKIDVKSFESNPIGADGKPITSPRKGAFKVENAMKNIIKEFEKNGNDIVVVDKTNLKLEHIKELEGAIKQSGLENKIIWWPE
ncbi:hypothetical protein H1Z61_13670 [Bacillus aquiflavi]|uniref:Pre-toxin TG domain-containing protein n=1 Tax=Bacillus aquiflavi TaxID=2672567 RepID=A0A6B3W4T4_9BACI|nr:hypothetical protein [Bacillus aquiflavi]MBA4538154.1 hypothetical protein [Bacillus aquiflavi]NEY82474.1 hypothetical protein [Bacillus aquiflavi]